MTTPTAEFATTLRQDLHDLSQPLTRLQWRLELGRRSDDRDELHETIEAALVDSRELMDWVRRIRNRIEAEENAR